MAEIRVPVTAPGAAEAAAQTRVFKAEVAGLGAAHEAAKAAQDKHTNSTNTGTGATEKAVVGSKMHVKTLDEEIARLKILEHQAKITQQARLALGESHNAGDVGALRRFSRSLPGGIGKELGKGATEAYEGGEGSGLRSTLGFAGAGMAAGFVAFELFNKSMESAAEAARMETEQRLKTITSLQEIQKSKGSFGAEAQEKHGLAIRQIAAAGGSMESAIAFEKLTKDPSAFEAYGDALTRIGPEGSPALREAMAATARAHRLGGGSSAGIMSGINLPRINRAMGSGRGSNQIVGEELGEKQFNRVLTDAQLDAMDANLNRSAEQKVTDTNDDTLTATDVDKLPHRGQQEASNKAVHAAVISPATAQLVKDNLANVGPDAVLRANADQYNSHISTLGGGIYDFFKEKLHNLAPSWVDPTPNQRLEKSSNEQYKHAEKILSQAGLAADALDEHAQASAKAAETLRKLSESTPQPTADRSSNWGGGSTP